MKRRDSLEFQDLVYGIHPIVELLKARKRRLSRIYTTKPVPKAWSDIERLLPPRTPIQYVERAVLTKLAGTADHQGVLAYTSPLAIRSALFDPAKDPVILMLDGVQDPRNVGALIRSASCVGITGIVLTKKGCAPLSGATLKASAGLAEYMQYYMAPSAAAAALELQRAGYALYAALPGGGVSVMNQTFKKPLCIVIGAEGVGVSDAIARICTKITIPQRSTDISYNASVAGGIILFLIATKVGLLKTS